VGNRRGTSDNTPAAPKPAVSVRRPGNRHRQRQRAPLLGNSHYYPTKITCLAQVGRSLIMRRRDRARLFRLSVLDTVILLSLGTVGIVRLVHWPHLFVAFITVPIALILLYVILRG
jgi:hypothetical protein